jgi:hypothetical protein
MTRLAGIHSQTCREHHIAPHDLHVENSSFDQDGALV